MSDNPLKRAISRTNRRPQTPAPKPASKGKVVKQSKAKIEYRNPMSALGEMYLGACNHPFSKSQYEAMVRSPKLPPSFLSIRASEPKDGNVCLYASSVFGGTALKGLVRKLKTSCTKVAGSGSKTSCGELIKDLERRLPQKPVTPKAPSFHDPKAASPLNKEFWMARWHGGWGGFDFGAGMGVVAGGFWAIKKIIDKIRGGGGGNSGNKTGDPENTSKPSAPDTGSKMVAAALGMAATLVNKLDDIEFPSIPIVPAMDTIDGNYILDPTSAAQAAYNGMTAAAWSEVAAPTSYVISWVAVGAWLSSAAESIENIWAPHHPDTNTWADHNISEPMAQAGRNMAVSITAGAKTLMSVKPEQMPSVVFVAGVIITAPIWIPAVLAYGSLSLVGSMVGPALQEMMDKRPGNRRTPGPA